MNQYSLNATITIPPVDHETVLLARVYRLILSWPCPQCGQPYPCIHDTEHPAKGETNENGGVETA